MGRKLILPQNSWPRVWELGTRILGPRDAGERRRPWKHVQSPFQKLADSSHRRRSHPARRDLDPQSWGMCGLGSWIENKSERIRNTESTSGRRGAGGETYREPERGGGTYGGEKAGVNGDRRGRGRKQVTCSASLVSPPFLSYCPSFLRRTTFLSQASSSFKASLLFLLEWLIPSFISNALKPSLI